MLKLTMPAGAATVPPRPIWVNPTAIQCVNERFVRKDVNSYVVEGSHVTVNSSEEGCFAVIEKAEDIVKWIGQYV